jgi:glycerophosphoryl diester phosphodiesterase
MFETSKIFHRLRRDKARVVIAALLSFDVAVPPAIASDILIGRAVLPATTFAPGPTSGQQLGSAPINGQAVPFVDKQPVQGFSAVADNGDGSFMVMADNGFGAMENSSDFNLRVYRIRPDFKTTQGGSGTIQVETSIELHDPDKKIPFTIANHFSAERVLTGADLDIESLQVAPDDTPVQANRMTTSSSLSSWISRWPTAGIAVPEAGSSKDHLAVTKW